MRRHPLWIFILSCSIQNHAEITVKFNNATHYDLKPENTVIYRDYGNQAFVKIMNYLHIG